MLTRQNKLYQLIEERENCARCMGLNECRNRIKGYQPFLQTLNGLLYFSSSPCEYQKVEMQRQ